MRARVFAAVAVAMLAAACAGAAAPTKPRAVDVRQIVSTTSFGMCGEYCSTRLELSDGQAVFVIEGRGGRLQRDLPDRRFTAPLPVEEWRELSRLAAATDLSGLPDVIGCPDCADGGAESLTLVTAAGARKITFDHGATINEAKPLLDRVRAWRTRLTPAR